MSSSLVPLLSFAVALFIYLTTRNPAYSGIAAIIAWRVLSLFVQRTGNRRNQDQIRNPLPMPSTTSSTRSREVTAESPSTAVDAPSRDGPPLLTDLFAKIAPNAASRPEAMDRNIDQSSDGQLRSDESRQTESPIANAAIAESRPEAMDHNVDQASDGQLRSDEFRQSRSPVANAAKAESRPEAMDRNVDQASDGQLRSDEFRQSQSPIVAKSDHTMPDWMYELAELDKRASSGDVSDVEYDRLYDKILAQS